MYSVVLSNASSRCITISLHTGKKQPIQDLHLLQQNQVVINFEINCSYKIDLAVEFPTSLSLVTPCCPDFTHSARYKSCKNYLLHDSLSLFVMYDHANHHLSNASGRNKRITLVRLSIRVQRCSLDR